jgi:hypothetical protein
MDGTAVARTVESMATSPVLSITEMRTGPRSDRKPTAASPGMPLFRDNAEVPFADEPKLPA